MRGLEDVPIIEVPPDPQAALRILAGMEAVVSVRLHGVIFSALARTPCVPIIYDAKVAAVAEQLGLQDVSVPVSSASGASILACLSKACLPTRVEGVSARVLAARAALLDTRTSLAATFKP
jgi:polysaccharide pyruvyl transferase WcaK-like protein